MGSHQIINGDQIQLGQGENGPRSNRPRPCCSKTYYRKRYRAVALRKAARMSWSEQTGPERLPEGSKTSPEVGRRDATELISDGDTNHGLKITKKLVPAREGGPAVEKKAAIGGGSPREVGQASGKAHDAGQDMGQMLANRSDANITRRSSSETIQVLPTPPTVPEKMKGDDLVGQIARASVVRDDSFMITISGITISVAEADHADKENISDGVGSFVGNKSGTCVMENEEILGVGNSEVGDEGLENIIPKMVSNS